MDLTDLQWQVIQPLVPPVHQGRGRPSLDPRLLLDGIFWKLRSGSPWRALPSHYPSHQSCYRFYEELRLSGLFDTLVFSLYSDLVYRGNFTPYQAVTEKRIMIKKNERAFILFIAPRYNDDWRTHTALLFIQIELHHLLKHLLSQSETGRLQRNGRITVGFLFSSWPKYAPLGFAGQPTETYSEPEDFVFEVGNG